MFYNITVHGGSFTASVGDLKNDASITFDQAVAGTYAGAMSGSGALIKSGPGTLTLTGANTYTGGTVINHGTLEINSNASLGAAGTAVALNDATIVIGSIRGPEINRNLRPLTITGNGEISGNPGGDYYWFGAIGGTGRLVKSGSSTLQLDGANTYSGGTLVNDGILRFSADNNFGAAGTAIFLNGGSLGTISPSPSVMTRNIVLLGNGGFDVSIYPLNWRGNIDGTGELLKTGQGELELTGVNSYSGGTRVERGVLRVASDNKLGTSGSAVTLVENGGFRAAGTFTTSRNFNLLGTGGIFLVDPAQALTIAGSVSGTNLTKFGDGSLILTGANSYTGKIFHNGGIIQGNSESLRGDIVFDRNPGSRSVVFDQALDGTFAGNITNVGAITKSNNGKLTLTGNNTYSGGTTITAGTLEGSSKSLPGNVLNNAALIFDQSDNGAYDGIVSGSGAFAKNGVGKLSISGIQTYTGATNINAGNLSVNGSIVSSSVVNVNTGGTLSGSGNFGNVNVDGGTLSPGNSIGTMHVRGNLTMSPNAKYYVELNGQTSDLIDVGGTANVQSSIFEVAHDTNTAASPVLPGKTYTILTTQGGLTVTAPTVAIADFPFLSFALTADAFNGYLTTSRSAERFADLASTPNQKAVANALDTAPAGSPLWQQVVGATEAQARGAFSSLGNASLHASAAGVLSAQSAYLRDAVTDRLRQDFAYGTSLAPVSNTLAFAEQAPRNAYAAGTAIPFVKAPPLSFAPAPVYSAWAQGLGSRGSLKGDANTGRTDHSLGGVISGIDATFNGTWRIGLAGGYSQTSFNLSGVAASGTSDSYHVALYGGGQVGDWGFRSGASFSWNDVVTTRQISAINLAGSTRGDYGATTTQVFGEVGRSFASAYGALEPFANVAYVRVDGDVNEFGVRR